MNFFSWLMSFMTFRTGLALLHNIFKHYRPEELSFGPNVQPRGWNRKDVVQVAYSWQEPPSSSVSFATYSIPSHVSHFGQEGVWVLLSTCQRTVSSLVFSGTCNSFVVLKTGTSAESGQPLFFSRWCWLLLF